MSSSVPTPVTATAPTSDVDPTTPAPTAWTPRRIKRTKLFAVIVFIAGFVAMAAANMNWVTVTVNPATPPVCGTSSTAQYVDALGEPAQITVPVLCKNGWELVKATAHSAAPAGQLTIPGPSVPSLASVPAVSAWLAIAALMLTAGLLARHALVAGLALLPWLMASTSANVTKSAVAWRLDPSQLHIGTGLSVLGIIAPIMFVLLIAATFFVAKVNHETRKMRTPAGASTTSAALAAAAAVLARGANTSGNAGAQAQIAADHSNNASAH